MYACRPSQTRGGCWLNDVESSLRRERAESLSFFLVARSSPEFVAAGMAISSVVVEHLHSQFRG